MFDISVGHFPNPFSMCTSSSESTSNTCS